MTFEYTEIFNGKSPLRGGTPVTAMCGGTWGTTAALTGATGHIASNLASCKLAIVVSSLAPASSGGISRTTSTNVIEIGAGAACSGTYIAFGI